MPLPAPATTTPGADPQQSFWAVVSYAPADIAWCDWIYFTLHGYPVPEALDTHATTHGSPLPAALSIFPDPENPAHASCYPQALDHGRYLIVLCSPRSAHCEEIDAHIRAFKRAGGEERIIALVVEGEPDAPEPGRGALCEWLPAWLRWRLAEDGSFEPGDRSEPIIVDARAGRASLDEIMASLLAALLDVPAGQFDCLTLPAASGPVPDFPENGSQPSDAAFEIWEVLADGKTQARPSHPHRAAWIGTAAAVGAVAVTLAIWPDSQPAENPIPPAKGPAAAPRFALSPAPLPAAPAVLVESPSAPMVPAGIVAEKRATVPTAEPVALAPAAISAIEPPPPPAPVASPPGAAESLQQATADLRARAERLTRSQGAEEGLELYREALDSALRYAAVRTGDAAAQLELAQICLTVGALQAAYRSSAEARQTLQLGHKALSRLKVGKALAKKRARVLEDLAEQLRKVNAEIPRGVARE